MRRKPTNEENAKYHWQKSVDAFVSGLSTLWEWHVTRHEEEKRVQVYQLRIARWRQRNEMGEAPPAFPLQESLTEIEAELTPLEDYDDDEE